MRGMGDEVLTQSRDDGHKGNDFEMISTRGKDYM
jgi:hypothetical protein